METPFASLEEARVRVISSMTTPTRPGKKPRPVFIVAGQVAGYEEIFRDLGGRKFRGQWSFWTDPTDALLTAINRYGRLSFADQVEARSERKIEKAERYDGYSENAEDRATASSQAAHEIGRYIPMGQPILVGHHSEKRHRRDLNRIDSNMRKSIEETKKAEYFSDKSTNLERDAKRIIEDRSYIMNRIEEEEAYLRRLQKHSASYSDYTARVNETQEKIDHWKSRITLVEIQLREAGKRVATAENIKTGFWVKYLSQWFEVIRVSKKSVTVCNWLGVPSLTWKARYADIDDYRDPSEVKYQVAESNDPNASQEHQRTAIET
jgi:hypothetical protein